jgi:HEAT repeat protein
MGGAPGAEVLARHRERLVPELRRLLSDAKLAAGAARRLGEARDTESVDDLVRLAGRPATAQGAAEGLLALGATEAAFRAARRAPGASAAFDGASDAEPFLLDRIGLGPHAERRAALELLGRCGGEATVRRLASKPVARNLRDAAAATLGAIGGEEAIVALHRMGAERALRRDVVRALGATGDPRALPVLSRFLDEDGLAGELAAALARIHDPASAAMLADLAVRGSGSEQAARALTGMPAAVVVPVLLERLGGQGRTRDLLVRIAGTDHGPRREKWEQWWDSRP